MIEHKLFHSRVCGCCESPLHELGVGPGTEDEGRGDGWKEEGWMETSFEGLNTKMGLVDISLHVYFL